LPSVTPSLPTISSQYPQSSERAETNDETSPFPGLAQWLEQLHLDPATPRFRGETSSHGVVNFGHNLVEQHRGQSTCLTVSGEHMKRRKEFWRTQPVRILNLILKDSLSSSGRGKALNLQALANVTGRSSFLPVTSSGSLSRSISKRLISYIRVSVRYVTRRDWNS
jgi:hypothetical protein